MNILVDIVCVLLFLAGWFGGRAMLRHENRERVRRQTRELLSDPDAPENQGGYR